MFDIGFLELMVVGIIALIVLGPERLPKAARTVGLWVAKAKQSFNAVKTEIDRELKVQELQQQIEDQKKKLENQLEDNEIKISVSQIMDEAQNDLDLLNKELDDSTKSTPINPKS